MSSKEAITVQNNANLHRYEAHVDGYTAILTYIRHANEITFTHTGVPSELEGRGIGSQLARTALDEARAEGLRVVARCPFVAAFIERHPEYQDLL